MVRKSDQMRQNLSQIYAQKGKDGIKEFLMKKKEENNNQIPANVFS